jgi:hypothetical protein
MELKDMATKSQNVLSSESKKQTISQKENDTNIDIIKKNKLQAQQGQQKQLVYQSDTIQTELNILDDDYMMSSPFRICKECGNDHSFKGNFEIAKTSVDIILQLLSKKNYCSVKTHQRDG